MLGLSSSPLTHGVVNGQAESRSAKTSKRNSLNEETIPQGISHSYFRADSNLSLNSTCCLSVDELYCNGGQMTPNP